VCDRHPSGASIRYPDAHTTQYDFGAQALATLNNNNTCSPAFATAAKQRRNEKERT